MIHRPVVFVCLFVFVFCKQSLGSRSEGIYMWVYSMPTEKYSSTDLSEKDALRNVFVHPSVSHGVSNLPPYLLSPWNQEKLLKCYSIASYTIRPKFLLHVVIRCK